VWAEENANMFAPLEWMQTGTGIVKSRRTALLCGVLLVCVTVSGQTREPARVKAGTTAPALTSWVEFSPAAVSLNNPLTATSGSTGTSTFTVTFTVLDAAGNVATLTPEHPLHVHIYGAPAGVITPIDTDVTTGNSKEFTYDGGFFPNNMEMIAWMDEKVTTPTGTTKTASVGSTLLTHANRPTACVPGAMTFAPEVEQTVPDSIVFEATVGPDNPVAANYTKFTMDTGSMGVIVPEKDIIHGPNVHGPGAAGSVFYDSSGYVYTGNYYLAPVSVLLSDGTSYVQSHPVLVLGTNGVHCAAGYPKCVTPKSSDLWYLGVGFSRPAAGTGDLLGSPSQNAFLQLNDASGGTDINDGYILSAQGVALGLTAANMGGYKYVDLTPNTTTPGDWTTEPGCYQFTTLTGEPQFCGTLLIDVGISESFIDLENADRPDGSYVTGGYVPAGLGMSVTAGSKDNPAMTDTFTVVEKGTTPTGTAPTYVQWINSSKVFINTGRRPLLGFSYLYSAQCGQVGFKSLE
jgi:hypothetical protein